MNTNRIDVLCCVVSALLLRVTKKYSINCLPIPRAFSNLLSAPSPYLLYIIITLASMNMNVDENGNWDDGVC